MTTSITEQIIYSIIKTSPKSKVEFNDAKRRVCAKLKIPQPSNRKLIKAYQNLVKNKRIKADKHLESLMRKANIRTLSGVAIITSLTKPFPCPGNCAYCPGQKDMPKSYLPTEPAAARAYLLGFDPYKQMRERIIALEQNGHKTDKIEFIVKGGSWDYYPLKYQYWFILNSFRAANDLSRRKPKGFLKLGKLELNSLVEILSEEQKYNEKSKHRIVGLTLETRPDLVTLNSIEHLRKLGCTRIELGLQATDNKILKINKRGHTIEVFYEAMELLRNAAFKVDLHFMPNLPGSTPVKDVKMYEQIFSDPGLKPDMIKIYPCTVVKNSLLYRWYKQGKYKPYKQNKLIEILKKMKLLTPYYCRISRLIRDIPGPDIVAGNTITNLREHLQTSLKAEGKHCKCLRCREVGHVDMSKVKSTKPQLFITKYDTIGGGEYFLSIEDAKRNVVFGFLRLRLPDEKQTALIRELHVYGQLVGIRGRVQKATQHKGLGKKLVKEGEIIAKNNNFKEVRIISGVGVRDYYRKLGYRLTNTYMTKKM